MRSSTISAPAQPTLREIAKQFHRDWTAEDWFRWPPDLFALTSSILRTTGVYRCAAASPDEWNEDERRKVIDDESVERITEHWRAWIVGRRKQLPPEIGALKKILFGRSARVRDETGGFEPEVCQSILTAHALADEVCATLGLQWGSRPYSEFGFLANFHLAVAGSLSLCARDRGFVLPKMRTPQRGLTIRSFSHHLSYHLTEAVVHWWTVPWFDREADQNGINVLAVPLPYHMAPAAFQPAPDGEKLGEGRRFGYFRYMPPESGQNAAAARGSVVDEIVGLVAATYQREVKHLHLVVLPEVALTQPQLRELRNQLVEELLGSHNIPMVVTGVRRAEGGKELNEVVISAFYADRWYELRQHKHHRWKLTRSQIQQYALGGHLNVQQDWWEAMDVPPRRLTFLTPTAWLSLSPLICEDLAQLEPLSDLIRGVGPTLVTALLLDGPQLAQRWPARYAGVLADDPGSSVLTVTSLGMARRCRDRGKDVDTTAVSWKDPDTGWESVKLEEDGGVLLSLKAEWSEEFTADGRSDRGASAHMVLQSVRTVTSTGVPRPLQTPRGAPGQLRQAADVLELTVFCFLVDTVIDVTPDRTAELFGLARLQEEAVFGLAKRFPLVPRIISSIRTHLEQTCVSGDDDRRSSWPSPHFDDALSLVENFLVVLNQRYIRPDGRVTLMDRWQVIAELAGELLRRSGARAARAEKLAYFTVLWAVHSRLMEAKRWLSKQPQSRQAATQYNEVREWLHRIEGLVAEFSTAERWTADD